MLLCVLVAAGCLAGRASADDLIIQQAKNEAVQLNAVQAALLLDYADKYNQYLVDYQNWIVSHSGPEPQAPVIGRDRSGNPSWSGVLSYLPAGFGTISGSTLTRSDGAVYTLQTSGSNINIVLSGVPNAAAQLIPNYTPLAVYDSGSNTTSLLTTPQTAGVAMEILDDVIQNYVRRDGAGSPSTFLDNAAVSMGSGSKIQWNNNDGQILGVSLLSGNDLTVQKLNTLSFGSGTLTLTQPVPGQLAVNGTSGSLFINGATLSASTGDITLNGNAVVAAGKKLYIGDKGNPGTYSISSSGGNLKFENSTGNFTFNRTGNQLRIDTDADEIYLTKNLRVSRVIGTADRALTADHATNADSVGGKTWIDIQSYVRSEARSATASNGGMQFYDTPGTYSFTVPAGVTAVYVTMCGGGGGGGGGKEHEWAIHETGGPGGGAGAYLKKRCIVTPGETYTIKVGAGGAGGRWSYYVGQPGQAGGNSSFGDLLIATGGGGGGGGRRYFHGTAGAPGTAPGGFSGKGSDSFFSFSRSLLGYESGFGSFGVGGAGGDDSSRTSSWSGRNGAPGFVLIEW